MLRLAVVIRLIAIFVFAFCTLLCAAGVQRLRELEAAEESILQQVLKVPRAAILSPSGACLGVITTELRPEKRPLVLLDGEIAVRGGDTLGVHLIFRFSEYRLLESILGKITLPGGEFAFLSHALGSAKIAVRSEAGEQLVDAALPQPTLLLEREAVSYLSLPKGIQRRFAAPGLRLVPVAREAHSVECSRGEDGGIAPELLQRWFNPGETIERWVGIASSALVDNKGGDSQ